MTCPHGHPTPPGAVFCPTCGDVVASGSAYPVPYQAPGAPSIYPSASMTSAVTTPRGLYTAAAAINWVVLGLIIVGTFGFGIICAAWFIPMTIQMHKNAKDPYSHTSLGVCTLLFCNLVSGILLLVDDSGKPARPPYL
jgi:hypothetical protein